MERVPDLPEMVFIYFFFHILVLFFHQNEHILFVKYFVFAFKSKFLKIIYDSLSQLNMITFWASLSH